MLPDHLNDVDLVLAERRQDDVEFGFGGGGFGAGAGAGGGHHHGAAGGGLDAVDFLEVVRKGLRLEQGQTDDLVAQLFGGCVKLSH